MIPLDLTTGKWDLSKVSTRKLLVCRDMCYKFGGVYDPTGYDEIMMTLEEVKEELAKREHIPNKTEAKRIRQKNAKSKRNR